MHRGLLRKVIGGLLVGALLWPLATAWGWGFPIHRRINQQATVLLRGSLGKYYRANANWLVALAVYADQRKSYSPEESPSHYIDYEFYGEGPYDDLPRDRRDAEEKFGRDNLPKWGTLPWHAVGLTENLRDAMAAGEWERVLVLSADLGHFIGDGHQPLHTTKNYDGQLTGNDGIHGLFESVMAPHFIDRYKPKRQKLITIDNLADTVFGWFTESFSHLEELIAADDQARQGLTAAEIKFLDEVRWDVDLETLPSGYLDRLYAGSGRLAWQQMELAAMRLASLWQWAWIEAGKPDPPR